MRYVLRAATAILLLCILLIPATMQSVSFDRNLEFEVISPSTRNHNETHVDFGLEIKVFNAGKYDNIIYKKSFYIINTTGAYFHSKTVGSFKLYSQMTRTFTVNFTLPREVALQIQTVYYDPPNGDEDYEFPLIPEKDTGKSEKDLGTLDIVLIVVIGFMFLAVLGLIYLVTSYTKRKQRRGKYLKY